MQTNATAAVIKVGGGRGFVIEGEDEQRCVITAAHCLPSLPPCHPCAYVEELTYKDLLGPLKAKPTIWAELAFADPIADIAVLGMPDNQALSDKADAYEALVTNASALAIADGPAQGRERHVFGDLEVWQDTPGYGPICVLSLDGRWLEGQAERRRHWLAITPASIIASGMSGSPILSASGEAIGVVSVTQRSPVLLDGLPARLLRGLLPGSTPDLRRPR